MTYIMAYFQKKTAVNQSLNQYNKPLHHNSYDFRHRINTPELGIFRPSIIPDLNTKLQ